MKINRLLLLSCCFGFAGCVTTQGSLQPGSSSTNTPPVSSSISSSSSSSSPTSVVKLATSSNEKPKPQDNSGRDNNKIAELKKEIGYGQTSSINKNINTKRVFAYGSIITTDSDKVHVSPDKGSGLVTVSMIDVGLTSDDVKKFPRGTRVKISKIDGPNEPWSNIEKVTGQEAKVKITNRSECLQHYGTDGASMCFKKFNK